MYKSLRYTGAELNNRHEVPNRDLQVVTVPLASCMFSLSDQFINYIHSI